MYKTCYSTVATNSQAWIYMKHLKKPSSVPQSFRRSRNKSSRRGVSITSTLRQTVKTPPNNQPSITSHRPCSWTTFLSHGPEPSENITNFEVPARLAYTTLLCISSERLFYMKSSDIRLASPLLTFSLSCCISGVSGL